MKNFKHGLYGIFAVMTSCAQEKILYRENDTMIEGVIKVVDEENKPVQHANVELLFESTLRQSEEEKLGDSFTKTAVSNVNGEVAFRENALSLLVESGKEGYWSSFKRMGRPRDINKLRMSQDPTENGYWEIRWNPTIILPRKINPRPMFAGEFRYSPLKLNETYAFDLEKNDWVRPRGKGEKKDILFTLEGEAAATPQPPGSLRSAPNINYDVSLTIHFPNTGDGIVAVDKSEFPGSEILLARIAPETGYQEKLVLRRSTVNTIARSEELAGYWFRVRSQTDPNTGEILRAHHGKIKGEIRFGFNYLRGEFKGSLVFNYMLSPDHQRSMEFCGENLLKDGHWPLGGESR